MGSQLNFGAVPVDFTCPHCGWTELLVSGDFSFSLKFVLKKLNWDNYTKEFWIDPVLKNRNLFSVSRIQCYCAGCGSNLGYRDKDNWPNLPAHIVKWLKEHDQFSSEEEEE